MKKYLILILTLLISCNAFAANQKVKIYDTDNNKSKLLAQGTDGQVLTQQADGSVAFETAAAGSGDITSIGDVSSGAAFDGTQGTTLTFNNVGGDATISYDGNQFATSTNIAATGTISSTGLTASRAVYSDANKILSSSATTATELGYVNGVTSAIQTQLDAKAPNTIDYLVGTASGSLTSEIAVGTSSLSLANLGNKLLGGTATTTDLYLQTTSGVGTTGADMHFLVGNNGATEAVTILNSGSVGIGDTSPDGLLDIGNGTNDTVIGTSSMTFTGTAKPKGRIIILAEALTCRTTSGCTDAGQKETTTNKVNYRPKAFGNASDQYAQVRFVMPENYDGGTVQVEYEWTTDTADTVSAGGVAFYFQLMSITNDDAIDTAFGTAVEVNDDFIVSGDLHKSATSSAITISGSPVGGDAVWLQIYRNVADADDDLSGGVTNAAFLDKVTLIYGIDALSTED